jgi:sugar phosphate isomerase/epimerase
VVINVEPHGPYTNDLEFMENLFRHFDSEYLRCNFDTGNTFIAGHDPLEYLKALRKYIVHCHIKDVSPALAAAVRGEETGIASSEVFVGGGANAGNIQKCLDYLTQTGWDGVVSIECSGTDENTAKSVDWMRQAVKAAKRLLKR